MVGEKKWIIWRDIRNMKNGQDGCFETKGRGNKWHEVKEGSIRNGGKTDEIDEDEDYAGVIHFYLPASGEEMQTRCAATVRENLYDVCAVHLFVFVCQTG